MSRVVPTHYWMIVIIAGHVDACSIWKGGNVEGRDRGVAAVLSLTVDMWESPFAKMLYAFLKI